MTPEERAHAAADLTAQPGPTVTRRLSLWRVAALLAALAALPFAVVGFRSATRPATAALERSSFMPYVDVTSTPLYPFEDATRSGSANLVLAFVVSAKSQACTPSWGAAYSFTEAATVMDLDRRIARLRQRGGQVAISFGGAANSELSAGCTDPDQLLAAYRKVVKRYSVTTIDLDVEGAAASSDAASTRRAVAISQLQQEQKRAGHDLQVWLTLPMTPSGLTDEGRAVLSRTLAAGVTLAGVNGMTMDYGSSLPPGERLAVANESALTHLATQVSAAYRAAGQEVSESAGAGSVWQHIGATPMVGQNDVAAERFGLDDAQQLLGFAQAHRLARLSMWSLNRDQACGPNYANVAIVSPNCSGIDQPTAGFTHVFSAFTTGTPADGPATASASSAAPSVLPTSIVDDPATSPYPVWSPVVPYVQGTKVVWHRNVYQAKWWTRGDTPDEPVTATSQTPWSLIGPVLPGEHPQPTPTLSAGTYPTWSATTTYRAGDRVLYDGVGYQAKWYTRGDVPGITVSDPGQTPWEFITGK